MSGHSADTDRDTDADTAITVTTAEAAQLVGVSARTIRRWIQQGWLPSIDGPNGQRIHPGDLTEAARQARQGRGHDRGRGHQPVATDAATVTDTAIAARGQLDAIMHEWLAPLVDRIGNLERENGRLEGERDQAQQERDRLRVEVEELRRQASPAPPSEAPTILVMTEPPEAQKPAQSFWQRIRRLVGGG